MAAIQVSARPPAPSLSGQCGGAGRRSGFSLTEILVVIMVLAVLAVLTFHGLRSVMTSVRNVQCAVNMREIGSMVLMYVSENEGYLPLGSGGGPFNPHPDNLMYGWWRGALEPYGFRSSGLLDQRHYRCPVGPAMTFHIGANGARGRLNIHHGWGRTLLHTISEPSNIVMFTEINNGGDYTNHPLGNLGALDYRHGGRINAVFFDGHTERMDILLAEDF